MFLWALLCSLPLVLVSAVAGPLQPAIIGGVVRRNPFERAQYANAGARGAVASTQSLQPLEPQQGHTNPFARFQGVRHAAPAGAIEAVQQAVAAGVSGMAGVSMRGKDSAVTAVRRAPAAAGVEPISSYVIREGGKSFEVSEIHATDLIKLQGTEEAEQGAPCLVDCGAEVHASSASAAQAAAASKANPYPEEFIPTVRAKVSSQPPPPSRPRRMVDPYNHFKNNVDPMFQPSAWEAAGRPAGGTGPTFVPLVARPEITSTDDRPDYGEKEYLNIATPPLNTQRSVLDAAALLLDAADGAHQYANEIVDRACSQPLCRTHISALGNTY